MTIRAFSVVEIHCDARCLDAFSYLGRIVSEARREAREKGWTRRNGQDLCPNHTASQEPGI